ncbi:bifunctional 2-polyprenyl-6-hydroxyphenol methylase/3-demethylubiquinol 3-O-methyltransferase UbiG [Allobranchiibius sp. GilTou73]|uniref:class I SAM-dependent methyltransferase n=1 Tax=Allobranchiibius sp. GilTou73 TaxID=2904523 RepID=UPI001F291F56|nr:class I SAM-dependent methyltransferase [Allobranchiibius sp. GilTou73]UIJ35346.1 methyltransferase domain-containing protein [Allobranchiibius sp. GilTou73]
MASFGEVEGVWVERLGGLRNAVRQHLIEEQLAAHLYGLGTALDVGCGQGTQAIHLADAGLAVTGVDPSPALLRRFREDAQSRGHTVRALRGDVEHLAQVLGGERFDLVCAHGLLMYVPDARETVGVLADRAQEGGVVSFSVRNGDALAFRPGIRGDWAGALDAFDATSYVNELGATARAHTLTEARRWCADVGLEIIAWYGVRVFTDAVGATTAVDPEALDSCLRAETEAGCRDPYRALAAQLHVVSRRR